MKRILNGIRRPREGTKAILAVAPECGAIFCLLTMIWWGIFITLEHQRSENIGQAARDTANLAHAFEENSQRVMAGGDQVLLALRAAYGRDGPAFDLRRWVSQENAPDWLTAQIAIIGPDGMSVASTASTQRVSVADREHFIAQRDSHEDRLFISRPVLGRSSGRWTIQLTRKLVSPSGAFAGIVVLSIDCYELSGFYQSLNLQMGYIALFGTDGVIRARGPVVDGMIGSNIEKAGAPPEVLRKPQGTIRAQSAFGLLTISYRRLDAYPLIVMVAFADKQVLADYRNVRLRLLWSGGAGSVILLLVGTIWVRQRNRSVAFKQALSLTLDNMNQGLVMIDRHSRVRVVNRRALELLGIPALRIAMFRSTRSRLRGAAEDEVTGALSNCLAPSNGRRNETPGANGLLVEASRSLIPGGGAVHVMTDVTARYQADRRIRHMAMHDHLTGLGNRVLFVEEADHLLETSRACGQPMALLCLDLNGFKRVNDTFGHDVGDELLIVVARRLDETISPSDHVSRSGGDEFAILSSSPDQPKASLELASRVAAALDEPFQVAGQQLLIGASIGIATYPVNGTSRAELVRNADLALYAAKAERVPVRVFDPSMADAVQDRLRMEEELRAAIGTDQLYLEYQPQFRTSSLEVVGFEALVRWNHPVRGKVRPDVFIPIAEETGLVIGLGRVILEQACRAALNWPDEIRIAVNLSPIQFRDPRLPSTVAELLAKTGLPASRLELEVTEGVLIADERQAIETLTALRALGVALALDDFGTGYASLSYLRKFPFERIKLDRSFVQAQVHEKRSRYILESVLALSRNLGLGVVAEGVETRTQLRLLRQQGCQDVQGFLIGKPMAEAETTRMISPRGTFNTPIRTTVPISNLAATGR